MSAVPNDLQYQINLLRNLMMPMTTLGVRYRNVLSLAGEQHPVVVDAVKTLIKRCIASELEGVSNNFDLDSELAQIITLADHIASGDL